MGENEGGKENFFSFSSKEEIRKKTINYDNFINAKI